RAVRHRHSGGHRDRRVANRPRHLRSADRVLPSAAAARVSAADRHLVRHRRAVESAADLPRVLCAARDERALRRTLGVAGADPRRVLDGRDEAAGDPARGRARRDARDTHCDAHRDRLRMDDARRRRDGRRQQGPGTDGAERVELPAHRHRHHGHHRHRRGRLSVRPADALRRAPGRAMEGQGLSSRQRFMSPLALKVFPFLAWRHRVNRKTLRADALAGLVAAVLVLPQGVAYATLAGMPPEYGLYGAMLPAIVGALWGSSWHLMSGPTNATSLMVFATVSAFAAPFTPTYVTLVLTLNLMVGLIKLGLGLARLGSLVNFISTAVVIGFTAGAGLLIIGAQLRNFFGIPIPQEASFIAGIRDFLTHLDQ